MTYQAELVRNKWAKIALSVQQKYKLSASQMHELAQYLCDLETERAKQDKTTNVQHLTQFATQWAKKR